MTGLRDWAEKVLDALCRAEWDLLEAEDVDTVENLDALRARQVALRREFLRLTAEPCARH